MSTLQEIEVAIEQLAPVDFGTLVDRLRQRHAEAWDGRSGEDPGARALDFLVRKMEEDVATGRAKAIGENRGRP